MDESDCDYSSSILGGLSVADDAKECAAGIRSEVLLDVSRFFAENTFAIFGLLSMPYVLIHVGTLRELRLAKFAEALVKTRDFKKYKESESVRREVEKETTRLVNSESGEGRAGEATEHMLVSLLQNEDVRSSVRALLLAAASATWTSLESLVADTWESVLNSRPTLLAQNIFRHIEQGDRHEEVTQKQIGLGILAKYDFNVRNKLGSILRSKFDFTSASGIRKAYTSTFEKSDELRIALDKPELAIIEATRHLIVHRGGLIDEEYKRRTKSPLPIGSALPMDVSTVSSWANTVIDSGCKLLTFLDDWLIQNPDH